MGETDTTARCPYCSWTQTPMLVEPLEVARCARELEAHLMGDHRSTPEQAQSTSESWALTALRGTKLSIT